MRRVTGAFLLLAWGCGPADLSVSSEDEGAIDDVREYEGELVAPVDMHHLLSNEDITGGQGITVTEVQQLLRAKGSFLASYTDPAWGKTAAQLIVERSKAQNISPLYMLARIQVESRLIESGTSSNLAKATGCGCPDSGGCDASYAGFGRQVDCAAMKMRNYFTSLETTGATITGWRVGSTRTTSDGCAVRPANRATAALYTYTPWVGAYARQCGRKDIGGSSLVAVVYERYRTAQQWGGATSSCQSGTVGKTLPDGACVQSASDGVMRQCVGGSWQTHDGVKPCSPYYPYCWSATLGRQVPTRTCVQSRSTRGWFQCGEGGVWLSAPSAPSSGSGPVGSCATLHAL